MINTNYKATSAIDSSGGTDPGYYADLKTRLEDALRELEEVKANYGSMFDDETYAKLVKLEAMLKAEAAATEGSFLFSGGGTGAISDEYLSPDGLPPEFSVPEGYAPPTITQNAEDAAICDDPSTYQGTVNFEASNLNFSLQDDSITDVEIISRGRDLVLTVNKGGTKESWVIKDGAVRSEPMLIDATLMNHEVTIDASRSLRISDGKHGQAYGFVTGFHIWGSNYSDHIYGSQGDDRIYGLVGNDTIDGGAGNDKIFGDDYYDGAYAREINGITLDETNSNDDIRGGAGADIIYGGTGIDTSYSSDDLEGVDPDVVRDMGGIVQDDTSEAPNPEDWLVYDSANWEWTEEDDGTIVLTNTNEENRGQIDINMDDMDGYTMALADFDPDDPNSLIITFVGEDEDGNPQTFNLKIEDFFISTEGWDPASAVLTLNMYGSEEGDIIDFHKIMGTRTLESQNINIYGMGGNDIILGAEAKIIRDGIDITDPFTSTASDRELNLEKERDVLFANEDDDGYQADVRDGQIVISDAPTEDPTVDRTVNIVAPENYGHGYITEKDGYTYVILVKNDGSGDTIVYKFEDTSLDHTKIFFWDKKLNDGSGETDSTATEIPLIPMVFTNDVDDDGDGQPDFGTLSGGEGQDVIFGNENSDFDTDEEDFVVKGTFKEKKAAGSGDEE